MKKLELRLKEIQKRISEEYWKAIELLKDYIRRYGEIDWSEDYDSRIESVFCSGDEVYFKEEIVRVWVGDDGWLYIQTGEYEYNEHAHMFCTDTILDILCAVVGNSTLCPRT